MKLSEFISILSDLKDSYGDQFIWNLDDLTFPLPDKFIIELTPKVTKQMYGAKGGKVKDHKSIEVICEYDGVKLDDRSFDEIDDN